MTIGTTGRAAAAAFQRELGPHTNTTSAFHATSSFASSKALLHALIDPAKFNEKIRPSTKPSLRNSARKNGYLRIGGALPSLVGGAQGQMRGVALSGREQVG